MLIHDNYIKSFINLMGFKPSDSSRLQYPLKRLYYKYYVFLIDEGKEIKRKEWIKYREFKNLIQSNNFLILQFSGVFTLLYDLKNN